jgi:hypothetical protein
MTALLSLGGLKELMVSPVQLDWTTVTKVPLSLDGARDSLAERERGANCLQVRTNVVNECAISMSGMLLRLCLLVQAALGPVVYQTSLHAIFQSVARFSQTRCVPAGANTAAFGARCCEHDIFPSEG